MKKIFFIALILLIFPNLSLAIVVFEDSFDDQLDWSITQPSGGGTVTALTPDSRVPSGYRDLRTDFSIFTLSPSLGTSGNPTMNITGSDSQYVYGGGGKAFVYWSESGEDTYCGPSVWCSDGLLGVSLVGNNWSQGYNDIYIRYKIKFQPGWQLRTINIEEGGALKLLHASHYTGAGNLYDFHSNTENKPRFVPVLQSAGSYWGTRLYTLQSVRPSTNSRTTYFNPKNGSAVGEGEPGETVGCVLGNSNCIQPGQWHTFEYHLKMNSATGVADGIMELFVDGTLEGRISNINWISEDALGNPASPSDYAWNYVWLGGNNYNGYAPRSALSEQWYSIDNFVVSTSYVGPDYVISGDTPADTTPPAAPTGVMIQ